MTILFARIVFGVARASFLRSEKLSLEGPGLFFPKPSKL
jgi:hypothetical protein